MPGRIVVFQRFSGHFAYLSVKRESIKNFFLPKIGKTEALSQKGRPPFPVVLPLPAQKRIRMAAMTIPARMIPSIAKVSSLIFLSSILIPSFQLRQ